MLKIKYTNKKVRFSMGTFFIFISFLLKSYSNEKSFSDKVREKRHYRLEYPYNFIDLPIYNTTSEEIKKKGLKKLFSRIPETTLNFRNKNANSSLSENNKLSVKAVKTNTYFYIFIKFYAENKKTEHLPWQWDAVSQFYKRGNKTEDTICIILGNSNYFYDMWIWRSARTNSAGYADDFHIIRIGKKYKIFPDKGKVCWFGKYFAEFAGMKLRRFYQQKPTESQRDVTVQSHWENKTWEIIFKRKLKTENPDDVEINKNAKTIHLTVVRK